MKLLESLRFLFVNSFRRRERNAELDEELLSHIEHRADDLERSGMSRAEAKRQARIELGAYERVTEDVHAAAGSLPGETIYRDVRYAIRVLRNSPAFTVVAVLTLAFAIGANALVFAALDALVLRPLKLPKIESLYSIHRTSNLSGAMSYPDYIDFRDRNRSFESIVAEDIWNGGFDSGGKSAKPSWFVGVSGNYFDALGIQPHLGRVFHQSDEHGPNSAPYIVLSYAFWHTHFQNDPKVVGRVVQVNKHPFTIIGVAPEGFHGTLAFLAPDFFVPMLERGQIEGATRFDDRGDRWVFLTLGHLKAGITRAQAAADLDAISAELEKSYPKDHPHMNLYLARPGLYGDYVGRPVRLFISALMMLAGLILLAACANLGSLFAARAADRSREVALRLALGAKRTRVLRQLFTEAILISLAGGALGLWGSVMLLRAAQDWQPMPGLPMNVPLAPNVYVYVVALALALGSGLLFGAVPVGQVLRTNPYELVKSGRRTIGDKRFNARDVLVVVQIAICAVLVTSSIVAVRGLTRSMHSEIGFNPANSMLVNTGLNLAGYTGDSVLPMQKKVLSAVESIPGITAVGAIDFPLLARGGSNPLAIYRDGETDLKPGNIAASAPTYRISPDYFRAEGTTMLSGRTFSWHDDDKAPRVAIVNQQFVRRIFGNDDDALGKMFKLRDGTRIEIVGVVETGKYDSLTESPTPAMFVPISQWPVGETWLVVRSNNNPQTVATAIRERLLDIDSGLPLFIQSRYESMRLVLFPSRVAVISLGILGIMGSILSITGVFGMAAYSVSNRLRELGIRIALGAQRKEVLQAALGRSFKLLFYGSAAGLVLGMLASRVLAFIVYQATPRDPFVLTAAVVAMSALGILATWIPAQRAMSVDPLRLLREE